VNQREIHRRQGLRFALDPISCTTHESTPSGFSAGTHVLEKYEGGTENLKNILELIVYNKLKGGERLESTIWLNTDFDAYAECECCCNFS
jgi:hypothetical protein